MAKRWNFDAAVTQLGKEFGRRGMRDHLQSLRLFWESWKKGGNNNRPARRHEWNWENVIQWLCMLRIEPFERVYPLHPRVSSICPGCELISERVNPTAQTIHSWPGGAFLECRRCGACWLTDSTWEASRSGLVEGRR